MPTGVGILWNMNSTAQHTASRDFDIFAGRKYDHIAEWLGTRDDGQLTSRWMRDRETGTIYGTDGWGRVNRRHRLNAEQTATVELLIADAPFVTA